LHAAPRDPHPLNLGAWHQVRPLIARLLTKQPAGRPASAHEVVQWIESATAQHLAGPGELRWWLALAPLRERRWLARSALAVLALTSVSAIWLWIRPPPRVELRSAVAVVPLEDKTNNDSDVSRGALVADLLAVELQGSQLIRCIAPNEVAPLLSGMAKGAAPDEIKRRVNTALRIDYTVTGSLYREADRLVAVLNFLPSDLAEPLASIQASGTDAASVATELARGVRASFPRASLLARWRDQQGAAETFRSPVREANESYARGLEERKKAKLGDSIHWFEAALLADDRFALARGALAETLFAAGYVGRARTEIDRALSDASRNSSATARSLVLNLQLQRAEIAEHPTDIAEVAGRLAQQFPDDPRILMRYARALSAAGKTVEAQSLTARALALDSNNPQLLIWSASLQRGAKESTRPFELLARAEQIYRSVGSLEGVAAVERERGAQFHSRQKYVEARAAYDRAIQDFSAGGQSPLAAGVEVELVKIDLLQGRLSEAQQAIDRIATLASKTGNLGLTAQTRLNLGVNQMEGGDTAQAEASFLLAVALARELQDQGLLLNSLLMLGSLFQYTGRGAEARPLLMEVIELALNDDQRAAYTDNAKLLLALVDLSEGSFEHAVAVLESLVSQGSAPRTIGAHAHESLAFLLQRRGQWKRALTHADRAVEQFRQLDLKLSLAYALVVRAEVLIALARGPQAEVDLQAAEQVTRGERPIALDLRERIFNARLRLLIRQARWSQAIALRKGTTYPLTSSVPSVTAERNALLAEAAAATGRGTSALEQAQAALRASRAGVAALAEAQLSLALARRSLGQRELSTAAARTVWQQALRFGFRPLALRAAALLLDPASGLVAEERDVIFGRATEIANALLADCPAQDRPAVERWPALTSLRQAWTSLNPRGSTR
jgi:tetratricopeptide (TPR) repeat protein